MIATNVTLAELETAAAERGLRLMHPHATGRGWSFRLELQGTDYRRKGFARKANGERRAINAVCWHGHRDFFRSVYRQNPEARFRTALATYRNAADFERSFPASDRNIGSQVDPLYASEACWCEEAS